MTSAQPITTKGSRQKQPRFAVLQAWVSRALARDLSCLIIPGPEVALAYGLDVTAAGMCSSATPRDATVLLIIGELSEQMDEAAAVLYAQMPRPRTILMLGGKTPPSLPDADVSADLSQKALTDAVERLQGLLAEGAFATYPEDFDASVLHVKIEYVCPMHPDVVRDEPGSCPKCGMDLVAQEAGKATSGHDHEHHEHHEHHEQDSPQSHEHHHGQGHQHGQAHEQGHPQGHANHKTGTDYTCPMHPEVSQDEPGRCPECGMDLVPREAGEVTPGHNHERPGHGHNEPESPQDHTNNKTGTDYTCPMHPEVSQDEPGRCPECGMDLEPREGSENGASGNNHDHGEHNHSGHGHDEHSHAGHEHGGHSHGGHEHGGHSHGGHEHDHGASGFMSMIEVTKDLPRSADGLAMDWIEVPFGPVFPGLPGGLKLMLTLDGDGVIEGNATSLVGMTNGDNDTEEMNAEAFVERLALATPLAPVSYRLLACLAIERAAGLADNPGTGRASALERERIASHLGWLALLGRQLGFTWLTQRASALQLDLRCASQKRLAALEPALRTLTARLGRTPLLKARLKGIGRLPADTPGLRGPVALAAGDAWARLWQRLDEIRTSLDFIRTNGEPELPGLRITDQASGRGEATVDTPRGQARLSLTLQSGRVTSYRLDTACSHHIGLVAELVEGQELGDALVAVGSLDLSPWEVMS